MDSEINDGVADSHVSHGPVAFGEILQFRKALQENFDKAKQDVLFTLSLKRHDLWDAYIGAFPEDKKKVYNCSCCRDWFRKVGGLVNINPTSGEVSSALFSDLSNIPQEYIPSVLAVLEVINGARADVNFSPKTNMIGQDESGNFYHLSTVVGDYSAKRLPYITTTSRGVRADCRILSTGIARYNLESLKQAKIFFENDKDLSQAAKFIEVLDFAINLKELLMGLKLDRPHGNHTLRNNILTYYAVTSSAGKVHFATSVIGEFLNAKSYEEGKRKFLKMVDPRNYMRPKAAPSSGAVEAAEKIFAELNLASSLRRRSLRRDEIPEHAFLWKPAVVDNKTPQEGNLFAHLTTKDEDQKKKLTAINAGSMSWEKFSERYLKAANKVEVLLGGAFYPGSLMTASDPESTPILAWDHPEKRNPVSYYRYQDATSTIDWGVVQGYNNVFGVIRLPNVWNSQEKDPAVLVVLEKGFDPQKRFLGLFPSNLRPELYAVRSVIEAYSNTSDKEETEKGFVALPVGGNNINMHLQVTTPEAVIRVLIDRFD